MDRFLNVPVHGVGRGYDTMMSLPPVKSKLLGALMVQNWCTGAVTGAMADLSGLPQRTLVNCGFSSVYALSESDLPV
jgi:hypothetical protein